MESKLVKLVLALKEGWLQLELTVRNRPFVGHSYWLGN